MGQFLSWVQAKSSSTNAILKRIENGEARTLIKTLAVIPVYAGIQQMREIAKHGDVITDYEYNTGELAAKSWQLSGMAGWLSDLFYNRFAGPGSKSGEFYAFAPMFQMGASIADMITSFAMGKPDRAWDVLDEKILLFPEWRAWVRKHWFPKGGKGGEKGVPSKTEIKFADGGFVSRKKYNTGQYVTVGNTALVNELKKDIEFNRKLFSTGGFGDAFAEARANNLGTFEWQGNLYNTRRADETDIEYQAFLGNEETPVKVEIKEKPILEKENIIVPKKKPILAKENIIVPKKKPILKAKEDDGFSLFSQAEASIVKDEVPKVVENFSKNENENDNTEVLSAPFRLLANSFWTKWFGKKEGDMFTNNDFDKGTVNVLETVAKNALNEGRTSTHYTDYPLTKNGVSAQALVGEYKDVDGNRYSAEYKKKLEDEVNAVYPNNIWGKAKFAYDLATDPVMKAIFSVGGFSIQEGEKGYFINEHFNFNSANQTEGTALKKIRKTISNMEDAPVVEGSGPEVFIKLGWLNKDKEIKLAKKATGGVVRKNYRRGGPADWGAEANKTGAYSTGSYSKSYNPGAGGVVTHSKIGGGNGGSSSNNNNNNNNNNKNNKSNTKTKRVTVNPHRDDRRDRKVKSKSTLEKFFDTLGSRDTSELKGNKTTDWETDDSWDAIDFDNKTIKSVNPNEVIKTNKNTTRVDTNLPVPGDTVKDLTNKFSSIIHEGELQVKGEYETTGLLAPSDSFSIGTTGYVGLDQTGPNTFTDFSTEKGARLNVDYANDSLFTSGNFDTKTNIGTVEVQKTLDSGWKIQGSADTEGNKYIGLKLNFKRGGLLDKNRG